MAAPTTVRRKTREAIAWSIAALAVIALAAVAALTLSDRGEPAAYALTLPRADDGFQQATFVSVSPDGRWLCFRARPREGAPPQLFVRGVDRSELKPLPGTERATSGCFWSPDNQSVLFHNGTHFRLVDTVSGATRDVVETTDIGGAAINRDGIILLGSGLGSVSPAIRSSSPSSAPPRLSARPSAVGG